MANPAPPRSQLFRISDGQPILVVKLHFTAKALTNQVSNLMLSTNIQSYITNNESDFKLFSNDFKLVSKKPSVVEKKNPVKSHVYTPSGFKQKLTCVQPAKDLFMTACYKLPNHKTSYIHKNGCTSLCVLES